MISYFHPEKILHEQLIDFPKLPESCCHFTLGSSKSYCSIILFIYAFDYLYCVIIKRTVTATMQLCHKLQCSLFVTTADIVMSIYTRNESVIFLRYLLAVNRC